MERKRRISKPFELMIWFKPVWSNGYSGEEYEPDGRDWRELRIFLEVNPETIEKREIFVAHAIGFIEDDFWTEHGHRLFYLLKHYGRYGNVKKTPKPKAVPMQQLIHCVDCNENHPADYSCHLYGSYSTFSQKEK